MLGFQSSDSVDSPSDHNARLALALIPLEKEEAQEGGKKATEREREREEEEKRSQCTPVLLVNVRRNVMCRDEKNRKEKLAAC